MNRGREFMDRYRAGFLHGDADGLLDFYAFPLQLVDLEPQHPAVSVADREEWHATLRRLVRAYQRLEVGEDSTGDFEVTSRLPGPSTVHARWHLRRADGTSIYDFTAIYTLVDSESGLRIVAIAHDELPMISAALKALRARTARPSDTVESRSAG